MTFENKEQKPNVTKEENTTNVKGIQKSLKADLEQLPMRGATLKRKDQQLDKIMLAEVACDYSCPDSSVCV